MSSSETPILQHYTLNTIDQLTHVAVQVSVQENSPMALARVGDTSLFGDVLEVSVAIVLK